MAFLCHANRKGTCEGLGESTVNWLATKASFQRPYKDQILILLDFYAWCKANMDFTDFYFFNKEQHQEVQRCFLTTKKIPETQRFHCFLPISNGQILVKLLSQSQTSQKLSLIKKIFHSNNLSSWSFMHK